VIAEKVLGEPGAIDERTLIEFVEARRWFGAKTMEVTHATLIDGAVLRTEPPPLLATALTEIRFQPGTHDMYQLVFGFRPDDDGWGEQVIAELDGWVAYDALTDPQLSRELVHLMRSGANVQAAEGVLEFRSVGMDAFGPDLSEPRLLTGEQSNTSVVFGEELILKVYRRLEAGINPELEVLRFLTERGFPNIAALAGWYAYSGRPLNATLGLLQAFVPGAEDGWELALELLRSDPEGFLGRLRRLGEVTGSLHSVLGSSPSDPDFCPEDPSQEALALVVASVDEEIEEMFLDLPDDETVAAIAGRGEEVRERLRLISHVGPVGKVIRTHGDYHLGQALWADDDWVILDFEGEPARSIAERRRKRSPLRDVAGMLRSFAYAASASEIVHGTPAPDGWEERARAEFLDGYLSTVDRSLIPPSQDAVDKLLAVFELEKAVYELRYELNNRPDWVRIPVAGILRLLEAPL
jgi:trehalose synthase-fused probable maltokinase